MSRAFIPASANIICKNGSDVLLIKRSHRAKAWPNFWAFPGGKVDDGEFFTEAGLRELKEEVGIFGEKNNISAETMIVQRSNMGVKMCYFGLIEDWQGIPEILESRLITDLAWFSLDNLPEPFIPHHKTALNAILANIVFQEVDITSSLYE